MKASTSVTSTFSSSLERAFKTPILGDGTKYLNGFSIIPPVAGFEDDETWGKPGGTRIPYTEGNWLVAKGTGGDDVVVERDENKYWKWQVINVKGWTIFFVERFVGEYWVEEKENHIAVKWTYTIHSKNVFCQPFDTQKSNLQKLFEKPSQKACK